MKRPAKMKSEKVDEFVEKFLLWKRCSGFWVHISRGEAAERSFSGARMERGVKAFVFLYLLKQEKKQQL